MIEFALDYLLNAAWQTPLLVAGALLLSRLAKLTPRTRFFTFLTFLGLTVLLPAVPHLLGSFRAPEEGLAIPDRTFRLGERSNLLNHIIQHRAHAASVIISARIAGLVISAVLLTLTVGALRLGVGVLLVRRLVARSGPFETHGALYAEIADFAHRFGVKPPQIRRSNSVSGPAVVGSARPVILVPHQFDELAENQKRAALLHECAHVIRRDYLWNLACETLMLPLIWHPAAHVLMSKIRVAREIASDQLAAAEMPSAADYARCLVGLARSLRWGGGGAGLALALFERDDLEGRVQALLQPKTQRDWLQRARASLAIAAVTALVGVPLALLHLAPVSPRADGSPTISREVARVTAVKVPFVSGASPPAARKTQDAIKERRFAATPTLPSGESADRDGSQPVDASLLNLASSQAQSPSPLLSAAPKQAAGSEVIEAMLWRTSPGARAITRAALIKPPCASMKRGLASPTADPMAVSAPAEALDSTAISPTPGGVGAGKPDLFESRSRNKPASTNGERCAPDTAPTRRSFGAV